MFDNYNCVPKMEDRFPGQREFLLSVNVLLSFFSPVWRIELVR